MVHLEIDGKKDDLVETSRSICAWTASRASELIQRCDPQAANWKYIFHLSTGSERSQILQDSIVFLFSPILNVGHSDTV